MRFIFSFITFCFCLISQVFSQFDFDSDKHFIPENSRFLAFLNIKTVDNNNIFEMRVWINQGTNSSDLLRITLKMDSSWIAEKYDFKRKSKKLKFQHDTIRLSKNWKANWDSLIVLGLFTLPQWSDIKDQCKGQMQIAEGDTIYEKIVIAGGTGYNIELLTNRNKRQYSYHCPRSFRDFYRNVSELDSIVKILEIIFDEFQYHNEICEIFILPIRLPLDIDKFNLSSGFLS